MSPRICDFASIAGFAWDIIALSYWSDSDLISELHSYVWCSCWGLGSPVQELVLVVLRSIVWLVRLLVSLVADCSFCTAGCTLQSSHANCDSEMNCFRKWVLSVCLVCSSFYLEDSAYSKQFLLNDNQVTILHASFARWRASSTYVQDHWTIRLVIGMVVKFQGPW